MKRFFCIALMTLAVSAQSPKPDPQFLQQIEQFRSLRAKNLSAPDGWLSLVALQWLKPGDTTVGSAPGNTLHLDHAPAHLATLHLANDIVTLVQPAGGFSAGFTLDGKPATSSKLSFDENHPSELRYNGLLMIVIKRGDRLYLRRSKRCASSYTN